MQNARSSQAGHIVIEDSVLTWCDGAKWGIQLHLEGSQLAVDERLGVLEAEAATQAAFCGQLLLCPAAQPIDCVNVNAGAVQRGMIVASGYINDIAGCIFAGHKVRLQIGTETTALTHGPLVNALVGAHNAAAIDVHKVARLGGNILFAENRKC